MLLTVRTHPTRDPGRVQRLRFRMLWRRRNHGGTLERTGCQNAAGSLPRARHENRSGAVLRTPSESCSRPFHSEVHPDSEVGVVIVRAPFTPLRPRRDGALLSLYRSTGSMRNCAATDLGSFRKAESDETRHGLAGGANIQPLGPHSPSVKEPSDCTEFSTPRQNKSSRPPHYRGT